MGVCANGIFQKPPYFGGTAMSLFEAIYEGAGLFLGFLLLCAMAAWFGVSVGNRVCESQKPQVRRRIFGACCPWRRSTPHAAR